MANIRLHGFYGMSIPMVLTNPKIILQDVIGEINSYDGVQLLNNLLVEAYTTKESIERIALDSIGGSQYDLSKLRSAGEVNFESRKDRLVKKIHYNDILKTKVLRTSSEEYRRFVNFLACLLTVITDKSDSSDYASLNEGLDSELDDMEISDLSIETELDSIDSLISSVGSDDLGLDDLDKGIEEELSLDGLEGFGGLDDIVGADELNQIDLGLSQNTDFGTDSSFSIDIGKKSAPVEDESAVAIKMLRLIKRALLQYNTNEESVEEVSVNRRSRRRSLQASDKTQLEKYEGLASMMVEPLDPSSLDLLMIEYYKLCQSIKDYDYFSELSSSSDEAVLRFIEVFQNEYLDFEDLRFSSLKSIIGDIGTGSERTLKKGINKDHVLNFLVNHIFDRISEIGIDTSNEGLDSLMAHVCMRQTTMQKELLPILSNRFVAYRNIKLPDFIRLNFTEIDAIILYLEDVIAKGDSANYILFGIDSGSILDVQAAATDRSSANRNEMYARLKCARIIKQCKQNYGTADYSNRKILTDQWLSDCKLLIGAKQELGDEEGVYIEFVNQIKEGLKDKARISIARLFEDIDKVNSLLSDKPYKAGMKKVQERVDTTNMFGGGLRAIEVERKADLLSGSALKDMLGDLGIRTSDVNELVNEFIDSLVASSSVGKLLDSEKSRNKSSERSSLIANHIVTLFKIFCICWSYDIFRGIEYKPVDYQSENHNFVTAVQDGYYNGKLVMDMVRYDGLEHNVGVKIEELESFEKSVTDRVLSEFKSYREFRDFTAKYGIFGFYNHSIEMFNECNKIAGNTKIVINMQAKTVFMKQFLEDYMGHLESRTKMYEMIEDKATRNSMIESKICLGQAMIGY